MDLPDLIAEKKIVSAHHHAQTLCSNLSVG